MEDPLGWFLKGAFLNHLRCLARLLLTVSTNVYLKLVGVEFVNRICESDRLHFAASKCRYYGGLVHSGKLDRAHAVNIVRKIMLEEFSIELL